MDEWRTGLPGRMLGHEKVATTNKTLSNRFVFYSLNIEKNKLLKVVDLKVIFYAKAQTYFVLPSVAQLCGGV